MIVFGLTDRGAVRKENQDHFRFEADPEGELLTAVLCDGMGGARAGSVASTLAVDTFMSHAANSLDESSTPADMKAILAEAVSFANTKVYERSFSDYSCMGMGSTLVALMAAGRRAVIANVGDSRAYQFSKNGLAQVSRDHSLVEEMVARGKLTPEQARSHPRRNIITRAVGVEASVKADLFELRFLPGMRVLLCSDGLTNAVPEEEIGRVLAEIEDPEHACGELLDLALKNGASDNVTMLIAQR
ncbi:MAG: Stp1/IreP family PP2C-type Ser/Thr phosphatase [Oscillospiraceae bacterium]|nr:Stp1/IreP family PP2C-type Ser/Thr phosphatase [Oscillospiraceae bacterium]